MNHKNRRILIVEDEPHIALTMGLLLENGGAHVAKAATLAEARGLLNKERFNIVLLDRMLPDGDGVELFRDIKADPVLRNMPVLILSGKDQPKDQAEGLNIGADDYMTKPFDPLELEARIAALLRRAEKFGP